MPTQHLKINTQLSWTITHMQKIKTIAQLVVEILKICFLAHFGHAWACPTMPSLQLLDLNTIISFSPQLISFYKQKIRLISHAFLEIFKFKESCNLIGREHFCLQLNNQIFPEHGVFTEFKDNYGLSFKPKKFTHQYTNYLKCVKLKKTHFWDIFGHYPQTEIFFKKSGFVSFSSSRHPNFM